LQRICDEEKRGHSVPSFHNYKGMREKVTQLVNDALTEHPDLFLIDLVISADNKIAVVLDGDHGITVEDCIKMSRAVEHNLDREEEDFSLEVMSAGVSEPLTLPRQFKKNVGRTLNVTTDKGETIEGKITQTTNEAVTLEWKSREPKPVGKGKVTVQKKVVLPYKEIIKAKVMVTFN
jgi:ribosome maturation factor RimP